MRDLLLTDVVAHRGHHLLALVLWKDPPVQLLAPVPAAWLGLGSGWGLGLAGQIHPFSCLHQWPPPAYVKTRALIWPASAAEAADWPRRTEAWSSQRHALALTGASGEPAGRSLCDPCLSTQVATDRDELPFLLVGVACDEHSAAYVHGHRAYRPPSVGEEGYGFAENCNAACRPRASEKKKLAWEIAR